MTTYTFRRATHADVPAILNIYAPFIENTTVTFEYDVPTLAEFTCRFETITADFPWYVCEADQEIVGYAYAAPAFTRAAFRWDADLSAYVAPAHQHREIGKKFYEILENELFERGYHNIYALVTGKNETSRLFHQSLGYTLLGTLTDTGFKHGEWLDLYWYGKRIRPLDPPASFPSK